MPLQTAFNKFTSPHPISLGLKATVCFQKENSFPGQTQHKKTWQLGKCALNHSNNNMNVPPKNPAQV